MEIIIILLLIFLNGFFSMSEIALVSARRSNLQADAEKGKKGAKTALKLASDPDRFLSAVQIGITLIGILTGIFSGKQLTDDFSAFLQGLGMGASAASAVAQTIIVVIVMLASIILGELVPKRIGINAAEKVAKLVAGPISFVSAIASPFVWFLSKTTALIVRICGIRQQEVKVTEEEIKTMIQESTEDGELSVVEQDIVERVFALGDLRVGTIMTLRDDIAWVDLNMKEEEIREVIEDNIYEEYPVVDGDLSHVLGVLNIKDYVLNIGKPNFSLPALMREPVFFYENMNVYSVLEAMKLKKISRALVCDEFGSCAGIITLKDIMEALVGVIDDSDKEKEDIVARKDNDGWLVDGQCSIYDFIQHFELDDEFLQEYEYTTVAGLILDNLDHVPETGEKILWRTISLEVVDMDGPRIDKVLVKKLEDERQENTESPEG